MASILQIDSGQALRVAQGLVLQLTFFLLLQSMDPAAQQRALLLQLLHGCVQAAALVAVVTRSLGCVLVLDHKAVRLALGAGWCGVGSHLDTLRAWLVSIQNLPVALALALPAMESEAKAGRPQ